MRIKIAALVTAVIAAALVSVAIAQGGARGPAPIAPGPGTNAADGRVDAASGGGLKPCPSDNSANFDTYSVGAVFEGHKLNPVQRVCEEPGAVAIAEHAPAVRDNHVAFLYGTCTVPPEDESSCPLPISVQVFPACERNRSLYARYPAPDGRVYDFTPIQIRGTEAAVFDDGLRIEVYTGDATVVIWGTDAARVRRAANALHGVHAGRKIGVSDPLPEPDRGAQEGLLRCG